MKTEKPRVLFVSGELIAGDLACRLKKEGCDVKLYIEDESRKDCLGGLVKKTKNWKKELDWVGKEGLIIFDDVGYGEIQDGLRKEGYQVVGGSEGGDRLEKKRSYAQKIFSACGIKATELFDFHGADSAIKFVRTKGGQWAIKQNGHSSCFTYVGEMKDGSDVASVLENYKKYATNKDVDILTLQKKVKGVEIGVARYFNGHDWVGPIEFNVEHKALFNNGIGPLTGEMGTVMWYSDDENNKLFQKGLEKLKPFLQKTGFKGDIDMNFIIKEDKIYPLEATARFGCPAIHLHLELHLSPWKEFLMAVAKGEQYDLKYKKGFGVTVSICIPPFPYKGIPAEYYLKDVGIFFREKLTKEEMSQIHFEEVALDKKNNHYKIAGKNGFIAYITGMGSTIEAARKNVYSLIDKIIIPKMFYRTDIGVKFEKKDYKKLKKWGWI